MAPLDIPHLGVGSSWIYPWFGCRARKAPEIGHECHDLQPSLCVKRIYFKRHLKIFKRLLDTQTWLESSSRVLPKLPFGVDWSPTLNQPKHANCGRIGDVPTTVCTNREEWHMPPWLCLRFLSYDTWQKDETGQVSASHHEARRQRTESSMGLDGVYPLRLPIRGWCFYWSHLHIVFFSSRDQAD